MKIYSNIIAVLIVSCISISPALAVIYLQSNYGQPIQFVEAPAKLAHDFVATTLGNGGSIKIGNPKNMPLGGFGEQYLATHYLSISTIGGKYSDISYVYDQIYREQYAHPTADPIIMVQPGYNMFGGWKVDIEWVEPTYVKKLSGKAGQVEIKL
ncbi:MAG TPA: hypothetical protein VHX42_05345 [Candidatus Babeliales bacterium]|jgi:hypothetical protein|nr:hypothetical protein [Candidatus Babeliales bacterium]